MARGRGRRAAAGVTASQKLNLAAAPEIQGSYASPGRMPTLGRVAIERYHVARLQTYLNAGDLDGAALYLNTVCVETGGDGVASCLSPYLFNLMIRECCRAGDLVRAEAWLAKICAMGLSPNAHTFVSLINSCAEVGNLDRMHDYVALMGRFGLAVNEFTYNAFIKAFAIHGDLDGAEMVIASMKQAGATISDVTYNSLIHACTKAGKFKRAEDCLMEMMNNGITPNIISYNSVINACATTGNTERAEMWFAKMIESGVQPTAVTYGTICKAFARKGEVTKVDKLMEVFEETGHKLNEYFYASLLRACEQAKPPNKERAERVCQEMVQRKLSVAAVSKHLVRVLGSRRAEHLQRTCHARSVSCTYCEHPAFIDHLECLQYNDDSSDWLTPPLLPPMPLLQQQLAPEPRFQVPASCGGLLPPPRSTLDGGALPMRVPVPERTLRKCAGAR